MTTTTKNKTMNKRKTQYVIKKIEGKNLEGPNHKLLNMMWKKSFGDETPCISY